MPYDDMSYEKCIHCEHVGILYRLGGKGMIMDCRLTGKRLEITHCRYYYGTKKEANND